MKNLDPFYIKLGDRIYNCRKALNLSQEELAEKADMSLQAISSAERGKKALRPDNLLKISHVLGVSTDYLLSGGTMEKTLPFLTEKFTSLSVEEINTIGIIINNCVKLCEIKDEKENM